MILYGRKETTYIPTPILVIGRRPCTARFVVNSLRYYLGSGLPERSFNDTLRAQKRRDIFLLLYWLLGAGLVPLGSNGTRCLGQWVCNHLPLLETVGNLLCNTAGWDDYPLLGPTPPNTIYYLEYISISTSKWIDNHNCPIWGDYIVIAITSHQAKLGPIAVFKLGSDAFKAPRRSWMISEVFFWCLSWFSRYEEYLLACSNSMMSRGVILFWSCVSTLAPRFMSNLTTSTQRSDAATCNGILPS